MIVSSAYELGVVEMGEGAGFPTGAPGPEQFRLVLQVPAHADPVLVGRIGETLRESVAATSVGGGTGSSMLPEGA